MKLNVLMATVMLITLASTQPVPAVQAGDPAPAWQARNLEGELIRFPDKQAGQTTVLVFWATWCPYCRVFMPYLPAIESDYANQGVQVIAVNTREEADADPAGYIRDHGYRFDAVLDGDFIAGLYDVHYIPGLMIIGRDGEVVYRRKSTDLPAGREVAEFWDERVREVLDRYLPAAGE